MTRDIETLRLWIRVVTFVAAICTTSVPITYSFSPWYKSILGRLFMLQGISFAGAIDLTCLFIIWHPRDIRIVFWVDAFVLTAIAVSTTALAVLMWTMNHPRKIAQEGRHRK